MKVTVVTPPSTAVHPTASTDERATEAIDRFADALGRVLGHGVPVVDPSVSEIASDGVVIAFDLDPLRSAPSVAARAILVNADRAEIRQVCRDLNLLGAIDKHRYFLWRTSPEREHGLGLYGRKEVANAMGARITGMYPSPDFGMLAVDALPDLIALLAAYIAALGAVVAKPPP